MKRFINCLIPVTACNLQCQYCYIPHVEGRKKNLMPHFDYDAKYIRKALSVKRLGGVCLFNFCGEGETLLPPEVVDIIRELLDEGHYIELVTNMTLTNRIDALLQLDDDLLSHLEFKCSFHYAELIRKDLLETFIANVKKAMNSAASVTVELVPDDSLIENIPQIKEICIKNFGALCHVTVPRDERTQEMKRLTELSYDDFYSTWNDAFDSEMFRFKNQTFNVKRKEFCYAGEWALFLDLASGYAKQCYKSFYTQNIYENLSRPIVFKPIGHFCLSPHCFNSHALMTLGLIPDIQTPSYADMRNRKCENGEEWLKPDVKKIMLQKLYDDNELLNVTERMIWNVKNILYIPVGVSKQMARKVSNNRKNKSK